MRLMRGEADAERWGWDGAVLSATQLGGPRPQLQHPQPTSFSLLFTRDFCFCVALLAFLDKAL